MKKLFVIFVSIVVCVLFTVTGCGEYAFNDYGIEPKDQLVKTGTVVSVTDGQIEVAVAGNVFAFDGEGYTEGEAVKVFFNTNGDPTNPLVWWVWACDPIK